MSGENDKSMKWDRRRQARKAPQSFTFLQLERDEGGRVVNFSENGLCFESFSPIRTANPVPLWFSFNLRDRIEATGQVVWTDSRKEVGGLTFINLSPAARQQIRSHLAQIPTAEAVPQVHGSNGDAARPAAPLSYGKADLFAAPRFVETRPPEIATLQAPELPPRGLALPEDSDSAEQAPLIPLERFVAATRSQFLRGLLLGIVVTMLVGILVLMYALRSQRDAVKREVTAPSSPVDNPSSPRDPSTAKPAPNSSPAAVRPSVPSSAAKLNSDPFGGTPPASRKSAPDVSRSPAGESAPPPASTNAPAHAKLSPLTPDQLWAAVQSGDAKAAVALADLYLRGDGVPANCAQARILLQFAAQKNNPEAIKRSRDLEKSGCPTP